MLNLPLIRDRMVAQDLSQAALALECRVDDAVMARWLAGTSFPGPRGIGRLAVALAVEPKVLFDSAVLLLEPQVFWLGGLSTPAFPETATDSLAEAGLDMGQQMRTLLNLLPEPPVLKPQLITPNVAPEYLSDVVESTGIAPLLRCDLSEASKLAVLVRSLRQFGAILVPVLWTPPALAQAGVIVALPDSHHFFVYVNLQNSLGGIIRALAEALGSCYAWTAPAEGRARFAKAFADAAGISNCSGNLDKSPLLDGGATARECLDVAHELFETPIYRAIGSWQVAEGGRNPAFLNAALGVPLPFAYELSTELFPQS
jgi:transcriptional regulator with XRE-family HTH domain